MIELDISNLGKIDGQHGLSEEEVQTNADKIAEYLEMFEKREQGFHTVIDDEDVVQKICTFSDSVKGKYDDIVVLGIGGSALGTICLKQSLTHLFGHKQKPRLHVLDNVDPVLISEVEDVIDYEKTLFVVITKSGGTIETLSEYFYFRNKSNEKGLGAKEHFVFVTGQKGLLRDIGNKEGIPMFDVPENVGGRFSILTAVGLLPAKLIGIDIKKLLEGAREMRDQFLNKNFAQNIPFQLANIQYLLDKKGKFMNVLIPYSQKLIRFADWYRQLLAESIGKAMSDSGEKVNTGLTPINALGATDQHSQSQLYNEGPNDKFFMFVKVNDFGKKVKIPNLLPDGTDIPFPKDFDFGKLMHSEIQGTIQSLTENDRPNVTISVDKVDEKNLGALLMLFKGATAFLGELYEINAFDQPGVELSKKLTKKLLLGNF